MQANTSSLANQDFGLCVSHMLRPVCKSTLTISLLHAIHAASSESQDLAERIEEALISRCPEGHLFMHISVSNELLLLLSM